MHAQRHHRATTKAKQLSSQNTSARRGSYFGYSGKGGKGGKSGKSGKGGKGGESGGEANRSSDDGPTLSVRVSWSVVVGGGRWSSDGVLLTVFFFLLLLVVVVMVVVVGGVVWDAGTVVVVGIGSVGDGGRIHRE